MKNIQDMTQGEFDKLVEEVKKKSPKLYQIILDFLDRKLSTEEVEIFLSMTKDEQKDYIHNYKAKEVQPCMN